MTVSFRAAAVLAMGGLLAACAGTRPPAAASPPPELSATPVDGIYRGTSTRYRADSRACPSPGLVVLRVVSGEFQYRWSGRTEVDARIAPDGTISGAFDTITLSGHLADGRIEGDVSNESCAYHFRAGQRKT